MRPLLLLLTLLLTLSASGLSSAIATSGGDDDCCADGGDERDRDPQGHGDTCPPLCHACACSPTFAIPGPVPVAAMVLTIDGFLSIDASSQLPPSPPGRGVFHPPRRGA